MAGARIQRRPSFLWQGIFIMLPVAVLACVSLVSLHRDERTAEEDAHSRAAENVRSLARAIRVTVNDELHRFLTLESVWTMELHSASQPSVTMAPDPRLAADITKWEADYPGLKISELAAAQCSVLTDGRMIEPPDTPLVPVPPKWFRELSPAQRTLWQNLRQNVAEHDNFAQANRAFVESGASAHAEQAAMNLEQRLKQLSLNYGVPLADEDFSESGISFRGVALCRMLEDPKLALSNSVQQAFWSEVIESPSFIAPFLLRLAEAKTNGADTVTCEKVRYIRQLFDIQSKEREWLASLRRAPELKEKWQPPAYWARWTSGSTDEALAFCEPATFKSMGIDPQGVEYSGQGYDISFVPCQAIEAIFARALRENRFLVPNFAEVTITAEGKPLQLSTSKNAGRNDVLGTALEKFGNSSEPTAATFEVKFLLTSREQMLSSERRRAKLFGLLILGAAATAFIGLFAAHRAFAQQLRLNEMKSNFVSSVSHELRAPIASVRLLAESLERGKISEHEKQKEYFGFIVQECRRLSSLVENVLDFSRIEQGRKQYDFEPTNLFTLTEQTVKLMEPYAAEKGVALQMETLPAAPQHGEGGNIQHSSNIELNVDGKAIQQALVNLIDNAIKHSPKDSTVQVGLESTEAFVRLWVEDTGEGIPVEDHEKIFERFYRRGSELRRETQGVGIGLSIVKHIVEAHGGRVEVRSAVGQGSRFTIELPNHQDTKAPGSDEKF